MTDLSLWQTAPLDAAIEHILQRYHETHRNQLAELGALAQKVAGVHAGSFPAALLPLLQGIEAELLSHMMKEERVLFPMIKQGAGRDAAMPIQMMMHEHTEHEAALAELRALTDDFTPPEGACGSWQRLYARAEELSND